MCFVKLSLNKHKTKLIIQKYWFLSKLDWNWLSAVDIVSMRLLEVTFRLIILSLSSHTTSGKKCSEGIPLGAWMERAGDVNTVFPNHSGIDENSVSAFSLVTDKDCGSLKDKKTTVSYSVKVYFNVKSMLIIVVKTFSNYWGNTLRSLCALCDAIFTLADKRWKKV